MAKRKLSARQVITDLRAGLSNDELMEKYNISPESLRYVFKRLVEARLMTELQYYQRMDLTESDLFRAFSDTSDKVLNCPRCGAHLSDDGQKCRFCQAVVFG